MSTPAAPPKDTPGPESTAARVALWRARHVELDAPPPVLDDTIGLKLLAPDPNWRQRPDMDPEGTRGYRAAIVARARFIEDLVVERAAGVGQSGGVAQYVLLGAGLDSFVQRRPDMAQRLTVFEVDQPGPQEWKRQRLIALGYGVASWLKLVPVDFEAHQSWWQRLADAGFDADKPAFVASTGVTMYLTRDAIAATLRQIAGLAPGSTLAMTFLLPPDMLPPVERAQYEAVSKAARGSGTPFRSLFRPEEMLALAREAGFRTVAHVDTDELARRYFAGRSDELLPGHGESFLIATV